MRLRHLAAFVLWRGTVKLGRLGLKAFSAAWLERIHQVMGSDSGKPGAAVDKMSFWKFQSDVRAVPGMLSPSECEALLFATAFSGLRGDVVEIGSWLGRSTLFLAKGCQVSGNGVVHAVDTWKGNAGHERAYTAPLEKDETIHAAFLRNVRSSGLSEFVVPHQMTSEEGMRALRGPFRMIFIDGCHDYEPVRRDILGWKGHLASGGLLVLHDFRGEMPGSVTAIKEEILALDEFEPLLLVDSLLVARKH
jgi:MMP 1-O-methyltransferase